MDNVLPVLVLMVLALTVHVLLDMVLMAPQGQMADFKTTMTVTTVMTSTL